MAVTARSGEGPEGPLTVRAEMTDAASIDAAFTQVEAELGPVEVVVANAGITKDTLLMRMSEDDFTSVLDTQRASLQARLDAVASRSRLATRFVAINKAVGNGATELPP